MKKRNKRVKTKTVRVKFDAFPKQAEFIKIMEDPEVETGFFSSGVQYGKTNCGSYIFGIRIYKQTGGPPMSWIVAPTYRYTERARRVFMQMWGPFIKKYKKNDSEIHMVMPKGLREKYPDQDYIVQIRSADNPEHMRAEEIYQAWMDEGPLCHRDAYENILARVAHAAVEQPGVGGKIFITGTPRPIKDLMVQPWVKEMILEEFDKGAKNIKVVYAKTEEHPKFQTPAGKKKLKEMKKKLGPERAAMEYDGEYIQVAQLMFPEFQAIPESGHLTNKFDIPQNAIIIAGVDPGFGSDPFAVVWLAEIGDRFYAVDQLYLINRSPGYAANVIKQHPLHKRTITYYIDPSSSATATTFEEQGFPWQHGMRNMELTYVAIRELIRERDKYGNPRFMVFEECCDVVREFSRCHIPPGGLKKVSNNHTIDAVQYALATYLSGPRPVLAKNPKHPYHRFLKYNPLFIPPSVHLELYGHTEGYHIPKDIEKKSKQRRRENYGHYTRNVDFSHD